MKNTSFSNAKTPESLNSLKNNIENCIQFFSKIVLSSPKAMFPKSMKQIREDLIQFSKSGKITENLIRPTAWRLFLNVFPYKEEDILKSWITAIKGQRADYKSKAKAYLSLKKLSGDPLGAAKEKEGGWNSFFEETEIKKQISLDVNRTFQEKELFTTQTIKDLMNNILFIWAKENPDPGYKQGMNELLAILIYALYPFYFNNPYGEEELNKNIELYLTEQKKCQNELYYYFHDEAHFQSDLYALFTSLMKCGLTQFFDNPALKDKDKLLDGNANYLQKRCNDIIHEKLRLYNKPLYDHFVHIDISCQLFLQRWLKCLFNREFHPKDVEILWDSILAYEQQEEKNELQMVDYICVAMIAYIKEELMLKDQNECFQRLFTYPPIESGLTLVKLAFAIEDDIKKRKIAEEKALIDKKEREEREKKEREEREKKEKEDRERREREDKERKEREDRERKEREYDELKKKQSLLGTEPQSVSQQSNSTQVSTNSKGSFFSNTTNNSIIKESKPQAPLFTPLDIMPSTNSTSSSSHSTSVKKEPTPFFANISKTVSKEIQSNTSNKNNTQTQTQKAATTPAGAADIFSSEKFFNKNFNQLTTKELLDKLQVIISKYKNQINSNDALNIDIIIDALKVKIAK